MKRIADEEEFFVDGGAVFTDGNRTKSQEPRIKTQVPWFIVDGS